MTRIHITNYQLRWSLVPVIGSEMSTVTLWRVGPSGVVSALVLLRLTKRSAIAWESRSGWTHDRDPACNARLETRVQNEGGVSGRAKPQTALHFGRYTSIYSNSVMIMTHCNLQTKEISTVVSIFEIWS
jgi:hypothetical protein